MLIQDGPRQMNPPGLPGINLGSDAGTDGSGYGVQKCSGGRTQDSTNRSTIGRGRSCMISGISELIVTVFSGLSSTPAKSKNAPASSSQHFSTSAFSVLSASRLNSAASGESPSSRANERWQKT